MIQANLEAAKLQLSDEDYEELCHLEHQQRSVPAADFLKPESGPYKEEADVWEKARIPIKRLIRLLKLTETWPDCVLLQAKCTKKYTCPINLQGWPGGL